MAEPSTDADVATDLAREVRAEGEPRASERVWRFAEFELDERERRLTEAGVPVGVSPRAFELLVALLESSGRLVRRDELLERLWPNVFVEDATLGRHMSDVRRALGEHADLVETVPKSGYRLNVEAELVPRQLPVSPGATPEDVLAAATATAAADGSSPQASQDREQWPVRRGVLLLFAVMAVGAIVVSAWMRWRSLPTTPPSEIHSLAVLPFTTIGEEQDAHLGVGLADSLIRHLSSIPDLEVRPLGAVIPFSERVADPLEVGRSLAVEAILEGTLRRREGRLRVGARLLAASGRSLWAGSFDHDATDFQEIEETIALETSLAIGATLRQRTQAQRAPVDPRAYDLYLRGRYFWSKRSTEAHRRAIQLFDQALELDPDYAGAEAGLGAAHALLAGLADPPEIYETARRHASRALQLDPESADAQAVLGLVAMNYDADWSAAEKAYRRALEIQPNHPTTHHWFGELLALLGRSSEGIALLERAQSLDPLSLAIATDLAKAHYFAGQWDEAVLRGEAVLEMDPLYAWAWAWVGAAELERGSHVRALTCLRRFAELESSPFARATLVWGLEANQLTQESAALHQSIEEEAGEGYVMPVALVMARLARGHKDEALDALEVLVGGSHNRLGVATSPLFRTLRDHPRFQLLIAPAHPAPALPD